VIELRDTKQVHRTYYETGRARKCRMAAKAARKLNFCLAAGGSFLRFKGAGCANDSGCKTRLPHDLRRFAIWSRTGLALN